MSEITATSEGVFTTQKLQALLDSRRKPGIASRAALATAMTAAGEQISVHGIDAWFKKNDSNYGIERPSLERGRRTYGLPERRWATLLRLFDLTLDDLQRRDADFRRWCFERRDKPAVTRTAGSGRVLAVLHAPVDRATCEADLRALDAADFRVARIDVEAADPEAELVRVLTSAHALLVYLPSDGGRDTLVEGALEHAQRRGTPTLCISTGDADPESALDRDADVLSGDDDDRVGRIRAQLDMLARPPSERPRLRAPDWSRPEPVTDRPSIAVIPFVDLTGDDDNGMLADGLTEDVTTLLSRIPEFFVIAHSTMQVYRHGPADVPLLREQLGVRYLLKGSLRSNGRQLRVSAELVDAGTQATRWSQRFDRPMDDLFAVLDEITVAICAQLEPQLRLDDMAYGARSQSVTAWRLWQEGWHWLFIDAPEPVPTRSLARFSKAIELESDYALGHAGLAIALATGMLWGGLGPERMPEAKDHAETAYKLLPENPVALYAMGMITFVESVPLTVPLEYIQRAVELEPSNPMYQGVCGYLVANLGDAQRGVDQCLYATRLSPKDSREPFLCYMLGAAYIANEQYELAIETMTRCRRFSEVDFIWLMIAFAHAQLGETDRAIASLKRIETPRSYGFYRFALHESLWLALPREDKDAFLETLQRADIA